MHKRINIRIICHLMLHTDVNSKKIPKDYILLYINITLITLNVTKLRQFII